MDAALGAREFDVVAEPRAFLEALAALPSKPSLLVIGEFTPASSMIQATWAGEDVS